MIEEKLGICDTVFEQLLDGYQMMHWGMSWKDFISQFREEINEYCEKWKEEKIEDFE